MSKNDSGLAAVMEAADAVSRADYDAALGRTRTEAHAAGRQEGETAGRTAGLTEGATAERARITGIMAHGTAMPGHDGLVAEMIADGATSADQAAARIVAAEGAARGNRAQAIRDVETHTGGVKAAPLADGKSGGEQQPKAATSDEWKAEWAATPALRSEFVDADSYAAFKAAEASGRVKILRK